MDTDSRPEAPSMPASDASASEPREPREPAGFTHRQILTVFAGISLAMLMAAIDQTIVATALPVIASRLGGIGQISWVVTAYLLSSTASALIYGKLSDLYGRRRLLEIGISIFLAGSVLCGLAATLWQLVLFRALQGAGGGGLMALAFTIIGDMVAPRERGRYQGYIAAVFALASVVGPVLGGALTQYLSWRWIFYINVPIGAAALVLAHRTLARLGTPRRAHIVDVAGAVLMILAVVDLLLLVTWGGKLFAWASAPSFALAAGAVLLAALFVRRERRAPDALLPPRLFASRVIRVGFGMIGITAVALLGATVFLPLYLQVVAGASVASSGLLLLPLVGGVTVGSTTGGRLVSHTGRYKAFPIVGLALAATAFALLGIFAGALGYVWAECLLALLGFGLGLVMPIVTVAVQNATARQDLGAATSALSFARSLGGTIGVAIFGAVLVGRTTALLSGAPVDVARIVQEGPAALQNVAAPARSAAVAGFAGAYTALFLLAAGVTLLAFALSWFLDELPLRSGR